MSPSINRWMDKDDVVHIYNRLLLSHKKRMKCAICSNMSVPGDYQTKWSQSERERQMPSLKYDTNDLTYKTVNRLTESRLVAAEGEAGRGRMDWESGILRCKLLYQVGPKVHLRLSIRWYGKPCKLTFWPTHYLDWTSSKVLLSSTGNCIQKPVINHDGKEYETEWSYVLKWSTLLYSRN